MTQKETRPTIDTVLIIGGEARDPMRVVFKDGEPIDEAIDSLKTAYGTSIAPGIVRDIVFGMLEEVKREHGIANMFYQRSMTLNNITLNYSQGMTSIAAPAAAEGKDLTSYLVEPKKEEELDIGALGNIDFDAVGERVDQMQAGGGEVLEPSDDCEGGACKI